MSSPYYQHRVVVSLLPILFVCPSSCSAAPPHYFMNFFSTSHITTFSLISLLALRTPLNIFLTLIHVEMQKRKEMGSMQTNLVQKES
jgi:hypothetical protein